MAWSIEGKYFENCPCDVPCPCTTSMDLGADTDRCKPILVFHIDSGEVDGVDVSGVNAAVVGDTPKVMTDGNWRLGTLIDDSASDEQAEKIAAVLSGELGGPMAGLGPLVGENLGMDRVPMEFSSENGTHRLKIGDGEVSAEDIVPFGVETGEPARLTGIFHPLGDTLTIGKATSPGVTAFGIDVKHEGKSAFSTTFSWSA
jgi:hypothetical protein